jgi:hypothetical protein
MNILKCVLSHYYVRHLLRMLSRYLRSFDGFCGLNFVCVAKRDEPLTEKFQQSRSWLLEPAAIRWWVCLGATAIRARHQGNVRCRDGDRVDDVIRVTADR